ncbi:hypothetical protein BD780_000219 [Clostridium tetanomorphum]|uniref:Tail fiber protein n=1 Tax=Clostridium tetanomorphum TaxID=1553 RepID=A0A923J226_CLOTT|nr:hypothetical protein [Clostridium tetanomorphum]KAJ51097.1 hypothetical protein CTM_14463 [Clostridium tetanomorphum DSM 665]MBC2398018.1 hypothetical protein [Clostridium tetanomorphum]MBP1864475.1 hypothetical protein [Clostridium tetanomorphum]NRS82994.1 hypothetical protein [Clostridium tetanomorphum]NRZ98910.1 hypothetical protein [Clostridium tetanomorphum]
MFNESIEKFTTNTKGHAEEFNKRLDKLVENDKYLNSQISTVSTNVGTAQTTAEAAKKRADEAFQFASNGKNFWVDVIGNPLAYADTFATLKNKTQALKNVLVKNLSAKGQQSIGTEDLERLINKILNINIGKRTYTSTGDVGMIPGNTYKIVNIATLQFTPYLIVILNNHWGWVGSKLESIYIKGLEENSGIKVDSNNTVSYNFNNGGSSSPKYGEYRFIAYE